MPISLRFAQDYKPYGEVWSSASSYAEAVNYAVINGADIINYSFAADTTAPVVIQAFRKALSNGRDGKECVIILSAEDEIVINPSFEVLPNGSFELHTY